MSTVGFVSEAEKTASEWSRVVDPTHHRFCALGAWIFYLNGRQL